MENRRESLGELYELCDNSSYNCSGYAELKCIYMLYMEIDVRFGEKIE